LAASYDTARPGGKTEALFDIVNGKGCVGGGAPTKRTDRTHIQST